MTFSKHSEGAVRYEQQYLLSYLATWSTQVRNGSDLGTKADWPPPFIPVGVTWPLINSSPTCWLIPDRATFAPPDTIHFDVVGFRSNSRRLCNAGNPYGYGRPCYPLRPAQRCSAVTVALFSRHHATWDLNILTISSLWDLNASLSSLSMWRVKSRKGRKYRKDGNTEHLFKVFKR